jgi:N-acetylglucosaminyl-diphospho-decaprenol L-rhamnosyltransferase
MISVVIVNWNSGPLLERCVSSLMQHASGCELLVVDNASEDSSTYFLRNAKCPPALIYSNKNIGFAAASNIGWRRSRGDCILFLNPDTESLPRSVESLADALMQDVGVWAAGGLLLDHTGKSQIGFNVRAFPTTGSVAADMFLLDELWPGNPWTRRYRLSGWNSRLASDVDQPAAASLMVSRRALESLGGFDESFLPAWFEDVDLCRRIWNAGGRIRYEPAARFLHHGGYSLGHLGREKFLEYFHTNQIRYFAKHHGRSAAEHVRKFVIAGMCLRAALSFLRPPAPSTSPAASANMYWKAARHFITLQEAPQ